MAVTHALCTGGSRSGKSAFALHWGEAQAAARVFIATAQVEDAETAARVRQHQEERGAGWTTLEAATDLLGALQQGTATGQVVVVDCLTMWLSNCMAQEQTDAQLRAHTLAVTAFIRTCPVPLAFVTAELGLGMVPLTALGRRFRDMHGWINQQFAAACSDVCLLVSGLPLVLKGTALKEFSCAING